MKNAMERLNELVKEKSPLMLSLDLEIDKILSIYSERDVVMEEGGIIVQELKKKKEDYIKAIVYDFYCIYIKSVKDIVVAIKINIMPFTKNCMEDVFWKITEKAKECGLFMILDTGNYSDTLGLNYMSRYATFDAVTYNPYVNDINMLFNLRIAQKYQRGIFVEIKTDNSVTFEDKYFRLDRQFDEESVNGFRMVNLSSIEIQNIELDDGRVVYHEVAKRIAELEEFIRTEKNRNIEKLIGTFGRERYNIGAIVAVNNPKDAMSLREMMPNSFFLLTGNAYQELTTKELVEIFDDDKGGAIVDLGYKLMYPLKNEEAVLEILGLNDFNNYPISQREPILELKEYGEKIKKIALKAKSKFLNEMK